MNCTILYSMFPTRLSAIKPRTLNVHIGYKWQRKPAVMRSYSNSRMPYVIDLRSDVLTKPTIAMKRAMIEATFDDDVYDEDSTVHKLQNKMAEMFGMEAALFVPSGTMANLISVLSHCQTSGMGVVIGDKSHINLYEQAGISRLGGVHTRVLPNLPDGTIDLDLLDRNVANVNDPHYPWIGLVSIENTHADCGGKALPLPYFAKLKAVCIKHGLPLHLDGSRLLNATVAQNVALCDVTRNVDSVNMCFSKAIGTPIGSIIASSSSFIARATRLRKVLGGGWRQPGALAAAALIGLEDAEQRLQLDHKHAKHLSSVIAENSRGIVSVEDVQTNMIIMNVIKKFVTAENIVERLNKVSESEVSDLQMSVQVKSGSLGANSVRLVLYSDITIDDVQMAAAKICYSLRELSAQ